jgi:hypothetical protein
MRGGVYVAFRGVAEGSSATTFAEPLGFKEIGFEVAGFFLRESEISAASALAYPLPGDRADDRERTGVLADDDAEAGGALLVL